jgi:hypothetical protein
MKENAELINFHGYLNYHRTGKLIDRFGEISKQLNMKISTYRKIVTLMVEVMENNYHYINELRDFFSESSKDIPFFLIKMEKEYIILESGNPILKEDARELKERIDYINRLTYDELKEEYKSTMLDNLFKEKERGGLGIMKIARITRKKINYSISKISEDLSYFSIIISIPVIHGIDI